MRYKLPVQGEWTTFTDDELVALHEGGNKESAKLLRELQLNFETNPLSMFAPHGVARSKKKRKFGNGALVLEPSSYPKRYNNDGAAFLSDAISDGCIALGPNQSGKTSLLAAWTALRLVPCDPEWDIFKHGGVKHIPWQGTKKWIVASYSWDNVTVLWERIREFFPQEELGPYALGGSKNLTFGDGRPKQLRLKCGSILRFLCYTQAQHHWESFDSHGGSFDEQIPREKFIGWRRSITTKGDDTQFCMALTGHVLADRPDTGQSGWIYRDLYCGENAMGMLVNIYHLSIESTPDAIISKKKKHALHLQWVATEDDRGNPIMRTKKDERAAIARYWGGWEMGSGAVFGADLWQRNRHMIKPFFDDDRIPDDWTKYRVIDYGSAKGINCCAWFAVTKAGYGVLYRLLYESDLEIADFVPMIIAASHNERDYLQDQRDPRTGNTYEYWREHQTREKYLYTILDGRSCSNVQQGQTLEAIFSRYGVNVTPGCGQNDSVQIPRLKDWLRIDWERDHPVIEEEEDKKGCPRLMFFNMPGIDPARREIENAKAPVVATDKNYIDKRDPQHFIDCAKMWASLDPVYMGDEGFSEQEPEKTLVDEYTGY